jgi:hypothetical protein
MESPALGGSQTVVAASLAFSVDDLILVMKVVIFFTVGTLVGWDVLLQIFFSWFRLYRSQQNCNFSFGFWQV